jgi:hypothetical protein
MREEVTARAILAEVLAFMISRLVDPTTPDK